MFVENQTSREYRRPAAERIVKKCKACMQGLQRFRRRFGVTGDRCDRMDRVRREEHRAVPSWLPRENGCDSNQTS
jgi:hypothetical protein